MNTYQLHAQFIKDEEQKLKKQAVHEWTRIVGHRPEILVLHDPRNLPKPQKGKRQVPQYISLAQARRIVCDEMIKKNGGTVLRDGTIRYV